MTAVRERRHRRRIQAGLNVQRGFREIHEWMGSHVCLVEGAVARADFRPTMTEREPSPYDDPWGRAR